MKKMIALRFLSVLLLLSLAVSLVSCLASEGTDAAAYDLTFQALAGLSGKPFLSVVARDSEGRPVAEFYDGVLNGENEGRTLYRTWHYDDRGILLYERYYDRGSFGSPITAELYYEYDTDGRAVRGIFCEAYTNRSLPTGETVTLSYDDKDVLRVETFFGESGMLDHQRIYNESGVLTDLVSQTRHYKLSHNEAGDLTRVERIGATGERVVYTFRYDEGGTISHGYEGDEEDARGKIVCDEAFRATHHTFRTIENNGLDVRRTTLECTYTKNGDLSTVIRSETMKNSAEIKRTEKHEYVYDKNGLPITKTEYVQKNGTYEKVGEYKSIYNEDGLLLSYTGYNNETLYMTTETHRSYDEDGRILRRWSNASTETYEYDGGGKRVRYESKSQNTTLRSEYAYSYTFNEDGRLREQVTIESGDFENTQIYTIGYAENGTINRYEWKKLDDRGEVFRHTYELTLDERGRVVKETFLKNDTQQYVNVYAYDALGRLVECIYTAGYNPFDDVDDGYSGTMTYRYP